MYLRKEGEQDGFVLALSHINEEIRANPFFLTQLAKIYAAEGILPQHYSEIYEKSVDYTESFDVSERDMTKYIIGTVSSMDTPLTPNAKGARSMSAWMTGLTPEDVQKERDEVLSCGCEEAFSWL